MTTWNPNSVSGCVLWLDPNTLVLDHGDDVETWTDSSTQTNDAARENLLATPTFDDGRSFWVGNKGVLFDGDDDRMIVTGHASLNVNYMTWAAAVNHKSTAGDTWVINYDKTNASTVGMRTVNGSWSVLIRETGDESNSIQATADSATNNGWEIVIGRYDGTDLELFINGDLAATTTNTGTISTASAADLYIGNHPTSDLAFEGWLGDVVMYNSALSDANVQKLYAWMRNRYPMGPYEDLGEVSGLSAVSMRDMTIVSDTDNSRYAMLYVDNVQEDIFLATAPDNDVHNWTNDATVLVDAGDVRDTAAVKVGSTWYVYWSDGTNGEINLATGTSLTTLSQYGSNPVLTGDGVVGSFDRYVRAPTVVYSGSTFHMFYDGRQDSPTGVYGDIRHATSSDGISWTKDPNNPILQAGAQRGGTAGEFDYHDLTHPCVWYNSEESRWVMAFAGYYNLHEYQVNTVYFPHQIGFAYSTDLSTWTLDEDNPKFGSNHLSTGIGRAMRTNPQNHPDSDDPTYFYYTARSSSGFDPGYMRDSSEETTAPGLTIAAQDAEINPGLQFDIAGQGSQASLVIAAWDANVTLPFITQERRYRRIRRR